MQFMIALEEALFLGTFSKMYCIVAAVLLKITTINVFAASRLSELLGDSPACSLHSVLNLDNCIVRSCGAP
jgi:hypothetical protein